MYAINTNVGTYIHMRVYCIARIQNLLSQLSYQWKATEARRIYTGVARWHIFKQKTLMWVNFGRSCKGRCWYFTYMAIWSYKMAMAIWYSLYKFGVFYVYFSVLECCTEKNLATLNSTPKHLMHMKFCSLIRRKHEKKYFCGKCMYVSYQSTKNAY
jgi:hypothetical protein